MLKRWWKKARAILAAPSGLAGAFFTTILFNLVSEQGNPVGGLLIGWIYGVAVGGLMRLFRVKSGALPLVGLLCGPVPFLILFSAASSLEDRGGAVLSSALLGLVIGLLEWARQRRAEAPDGGA